LNTDGTYSSETWRFQTAEPQPLTPFDLVEPGNGDTLRVPAFFRLDLVWQTSVDPDLEYQALYSLFMEIQVTCGIDTFIYYEGLVDTMSAINLSDTLNLNRWDRAIDVLWWIEACSGGETIECENAFEFSIVPYNRVTDTKSPIPEDFSISQAYPNPFNSTTNIRFGLPKNELVLVKIIDLTGNVVETLIDGRLPAGYHTVSWNSLDYPAGVYICNLQAGGFSEAVKMVLVK
ncbi:T9SS type A sorting domain-containing protein, partial [bacterium]|nr:T9SS type A sorting domain-containing protein [bacterium]